MARILSTAEENILLNGHINFRYCADVDTGDEVHHFGNHNVSDIIPLSFDGGETFINYVGLGGLVQIPNIETSTGISVDQMELIIDGGLIVKPPTGYNDATSFIRDFLRDDLVNASITLYEVHESSDTGEVTAVFTLFSGVISHVPIDIEEAKGKIILRSDNESIGWGSGRTRSNEDQHRIDPTDNFLKWVGEVAAREGKLPWGFVPTGGGTRTGGGGRGGGNLSGDSRNRRLY